jgi:hypothetical protein
LHFLFEVCHHHFGIVLTYLIWAICWFCDTGRIFAGLEIATDFSIIYGF